MSDDVVVQQVAERAFEHLRRWLRVAYQSDLSDHHANALRIMLDTFARLTLDPAARGRIAIPLPAGAGKSFGIVAFITALNELDPQHPEGGPYSVTVAAQHVENLAALIRDLKEYGNVPDDRIGLQHEKLYSVEKIKAAMDGDALAYASMPCTEGNNSRPYLFTTHARMEPGDDRKQKRTWLLTSYQPHGVRDQGRQRDVLLWDEGCVPVNTCTCRIASRGSRRGDESRSPSAPPERWRCSRDSPTAKYLPLRPPRSIAVDTCVRMVLMRRVDHPDRRGTPTSRLLAAPALVDASSRRAFGFTNNPG